MSYFDLTGRKETVSVHKKKIDKQGLNHYHPLNDIW